MCFNFFDLADSDIGLSMLFLLVPAIIIPVLCIFLKLWWLIPLALWYLAIGLEEKYLIIPSIILLFAPFVNHGYIKRNDPK